MPQEEQLSMALPYRYQPGQMGSFMGSDAHALYLFESFIRDKLQMGSRLDAREIGKVTSINCPFCETGFLKLIKVDPKYSGGASPLPATQHYVGNSYEFLCSNEECDCRFFGSCTWLHID